MRKLFAVFAASILAVAACGARSELRVAATNAADAGPEPVDAGPDVTDAPVDVVEEPDVVDPFPDVGVVDCQDAGITYIYVISADNELLRFYPPDLSFTPIGTIECPDANGASPFSMAVDRQGVAYVVFSDGQLYRVSTLTASCKATGFVSGQNGFPPTFGMGFSANANDPTGETLFVSGQGDADAGTTAILGSIDTSTFELTTIGHFNQPIGDPELTGTKDAKLFGFGPGVPDTHLAEIDKATANITSDVLVQLGQSMHTPWAFAFWGGDFYFFTQDDQGVTLVNRYTPGGPTAAPVVATAEGLTIVGAGVSTCAPSE